MRRPMTGLMMLVGGGVVGAGLGLLFAPFSGAKSRKKMARFSRTVTDKSDKVMRDLSGRMSDLTETVGAMSGKATKFMHIWH